MRAMRLIGLLRTGLRGFREQGPIGCGDRGAAGTHRGSCLARHVHFVGGLAVMLAGAGEEALHAGRSGGKAELGRFGQSEPERSLAFIAVLSVAKGNICINMSKIPIPCQMHT